MVDEHPAVKDKAGLQLGLMQVLDKFTDEELGQLSKHFTGRAFDLKPLLNKDGSYTAAGTKLVADLREVVAKYGGTLLEREGGLPRLHCQFSE